MSFAKEVWDTLSKVDCAKHVEKKGGLSYLSWAWAWAELMKAYPESSYTRIPDVVHGDGSVEVGFVVTVAAGGASVSREMWLPVMDNKNNAIKHPDARKLSDSRMRCLVKCLAMFGLGHYIYAGEDVPDAKSDEEEYAEFVLEHSASIAAIKTGIANSDYSTAAEAWFELPEESKRGLWKAPSKGGCFSTEERRVMQLKEFRESYYGADTKEQ